MNSRSSIRTSLKFVFALLIITMTAVLFLFWVNNRYEPQVLAKLSDKVDKVYFGDELDSFFSVTTQKSACHDTGTWNFLRDRSCSYTLDIEQISGSDQEMTDSLKQSQTILERQGWIIVRPLTVNSNAPNNLKPLKTYFVYDMSMKSADGSCGFYITKVSSESDLPNGKIHCRKHLPFKLFRL